MNEELEALIVQSQRNTKDTNDTLEALIVQTGKLDNKAELEAITKSSINTKDVIEKGNTELVAGNKSIVEAIKNLKPEPIDGVDVTGLVTTLMKLLKSKDGEDGYTPVKGKDYYTDEEIKAVITEIVAGIRVPKDGEDGYTPIKGKDYFDGKKGEPGKPGKDGEDADEIDYDKVLNLVIKKLPKVEKIKEKTTDEIAEELKGKLSYEDLKDLPDLFRKISSKNYSFAELTDTPQDYKGNKGRFLKVNEEEDGLEYGDGDGIGDMLKATYDPAGGERQVAFSDEIPDPYLLPIASTSILGGVKVDGDTIEINDGVIKAIGGGDVNWGGNTLGSKKLIGSNDNQDIGFKTNNDERLTILKNGNVGIGTTNPSQKLDVSGKIALDGTTIAYRPTAFAGTLILGDGGTNLQTGADYNTFVGIGAGASNTTGQRNTANGYYSLRSNTTGINNTANGMYSLFSNTTGSNNTANGYQSLFYNTTGINNTANGYQSLFYNTTGNYNTANGYYSLRSNTTGSYNIANGYQSLFYNTTGNYNTANGYDSLRSNTTGSNNTANGVNAGRYIANGGANATGSNSLFLGVDTRAKANGETNQIVIGYGAIGNGSNTVTIGNSSITDNYFKGKVHADQYKLSDLNTAPSSSTDTGVKGEIRVTADAIYICIDTDTWVKTDLTTF